MAINGLNRMRDRVSTGRPGLADEVLVKLLLYKFKNIKNTRVAKLLHIANSTVARYWAMYEAGEIEERLVNAAKEAYDLSNGVGEIAERVGVHEDLTPVLQEGEQALIRVDEIVDVAVLSKIFKASIKIASGEYVEEKITGKAVKQVAANGAIPSKFGYSIEPDATVVIDLQKTRPDPKPLMALIDYFKMHGIDCLTGLKKELGLDTDETIDMSKMSPEEAGSAYQQLMNGEKDA